MTNWFIVHVFMQNWSYAGPPIKKYIDRFCYWYECIQNILMFYNYSKSNKNFFFDNHAITVNYKNPNPPPPPKKGGEGVGRSPPILQKPIS